jgi:kynurenine formamidase
MSTEAQVYDGNGARSPQWWPSRYGPEDERGAQNELLAEGTLRALALPREGRAIPLAQPLRTEVAQTPPRVAHQVTLAHLAVHGAGLEPGGDDVAAFEDQLTISSHAGCHVDGLGHCGIDDRGYNGTPFADFYAPGGLRRLGIEGLGPWVTRGVLLDVAALHGVATLPADHAVGVDDLERAAAAAGVEIAPGDAVLINTGWGVLWDSDPEAYAAGEPGLDWDGAHWLTERRVSAVGADNWALEALPGEGGAFVVHQHLLTETGTFIVENLTLAELAAAGASEFLFFMAPLRIVGLTGSPVAPVAVI